MRPGLNPGPLSPQAKSLTTLPLPTDTGNTLESTYDLYSHILKLDIISSPYVLAVLWRHKDRYIQASHAKVSWLGFMVLYSIFNILITREVF